MADSRDREPAVPAPRCQATVAPPRHFLYPAILLLLAEEPRHGYRLVDPLLRFGFGPVDRPSVYRALADLENDGLLSSWDATPTAGSTRHVYGLTDEGRTALVGWMRVLADEKDNLDRMVARFRHLDDDPPDRWLRIGGVLHLDPCDPAAELGALAAALLVLDRCRRAGNEVHIELVATSEKGFDDDAVRDVAEAVHDLPFTMVSPPERSP